MSGHGDSSQCMRGLSGRVEDFGSNPILVRVQEVVVEVDR